MNKHAATENFALSAGTNRSFFFNFLVTLLAMKNISIFDVFAYFNSNHEKLPIIYANIRV